MSKIIIHNKANVTDNHALECACMVLDETINITHNRFINIDIQYGEWQGSSTLYEQLTILYDLIKADLVVKE